MPKEAAQKAIAKKTLAKPAKPANKKDAADIERAASEGMAQPQGRPAKKKPGKK